jgi:hypothetical protein
MTDMLLGDGWEARCGGRHAEVVFENDLAGEHMMDGYGNVS